MRFAERMDRFGEGIFSKLLEIKRQKEERGETVIDLGVGAPNIPPARGILPMPCAGRLRIRKITSMPSVTRRNS